MSSYCLFEHDNLKINFDFTKQELKDFTDLWKAGISAENISKKMKRTNLEIGLLVIDRAELGFIDQRATGLGGL